MVGCKETFQRQTNTGKTFAFSCFQANICGDGLRALKMQKTVSCSKENPWQTSECFSWKRKDVQRGAGLPRIAWMKWNATLGMFMKGNDQELKKVDVAYDISVKTV